MNEKIASIVRGILGGEVPFELSVPEEGKFGHYSTNVALRLAKEKKRKPLDLAAELAATIGKDAPAGFFEKVEAVAPGFVNFWLSDKTIKEELHRIADDGGFGKGGELAGKTVLVEFTDPNPFKEFHAGHLMSNAIGESISRLFESQGAEVKRLSYGGDIGLHVAKAIFGVLQNEAGITEVKGKDEREQLAFWARAYVAGSASYENSESAKSEIDSLNKTIFEKSDKKLNGLYDWGREVSIRSFEELFRRLDTDFIKNYWESEVVQDGMEMVKKGVSAGVLEESQGAIVFKGESYGLHTRVFVNSRGVPTYEAKELGLTMKKHEDFDFDRSVVITGNEQNDYFRVVLKVIDLLLPELSGKTVHIGHGMLRLSSGKMSSRAGNVITAEALLGQVKEKLREYVSARAGLSGEEKELVLEDVAIGSVKYSILKQNPGQDIVFDFEKSLSFEGDSGPYVQYAHARLRSILRKAAESGIEVPASASPEEIDRLDSEIEKTLMRKIFEFPEVTARARERYAPSGLVAYLHKLAVLANQFYETSPVLKEEDAALRSARLVLAVTAARTLCSGLGLLGIRAPEKI